MAHAIKSRELLEISPYQADGGELVGRIPTEVPSEILSRYHRQQNPLKAIRARCLDCAAAAPQMSASVSPLLAQVGPSEWASTHSARSGAVSPQQKQSIAGCLR